MGERERVLHHILKIIVDIHVYGILYGTMYNNVGMLGCQYQGIGS